MVEKINYESIYIQHANSTIDWCPMDNKELYESNYKKKYYMLLENGWINSTVSYTFNKHGFRCPDFTDSPSIMFLGCSLTIGIGINIEESWSYQVANYLNLAFVNLGQGGGSNDTAFRLGYHWISRLKPKIVYFMKAEPQRTEIITDRGINVILPNHDILPEFKGYYSSWITEPTNSKMNYMKNELALKTLCAENNCLFVTDNAVDRFKNRVDLARDLAHPGIKTNQLIAESVINRLNMLM